jgi:hypothetical protein
MSGKYIPPPLLANKKGEERSVGVEFEFAGVELPKAAEILKNRFGGIIEAKSTYQYALKDSVLGEFRIELDAQLLRDKKYEKLLKKVGIDLSNLKKKKELEDILTDIASTVVPFEIITPPVPYSRLPELDLLINDMREKKAEGTGTSFLHAFGLHLNPEVPDTNVDTLLNTLKAFILLQDWIRLDSEIDLSRRITPYIDDYSAVYKNLVTNTSYHPDMKKLMDDYLRFNPSRNRPLDMLPVFEFIDNKRVKKVIDDGLTSARPAFHYRLPNCKIDEKEWSLSVEWNRWVLVELLANSKISLNSLCKEYHSLQDKELFGFKKKWIKKVHKWVYHVRQ